MQSRRFPSPTAEAYGQWQGLFSNYNTCLFDGQLPDCLITLTRHNGTLGYFCADVFENLERRTAHEISLNPTFVRLLGDREAHQTLVHEMCHSWRHVFGPKNKNGRAGSRGYHDHFWADKMEAIGLMPSDTGAPGGRRTGYRMAEYVIEGGPFDLAFRELFISGVRITWSDRMIFTSFDAAPSWNEGSRPAAPRPPRNTRTRFVCAGCRLKAWSRASARLSCDACRRPMIAQETGEAT